MSNSTEQKAGLLDSFEEGRLAEWLSHQGKNIIYALIAILVLLVIVYRFSSSQSAKQEQDYIQAAQDITLLTRPATTQSAAANDEVLKRLNDIMTRHPELHAAYDGTIAQTLLDRNQPALAKPYATATLKRTQADDLPLYADYASTSLVISEQNYQEALTKAQALQQQMIQSLNQQSVNERFFGEELFALNLLRIAMLQHKLGNKTAELQTWQEWKQYAALENVKEILPAKVDAQAFRAVIQQLAVGTFSLPDYIEYRIKTLSN